MLINELGNDSCIRSDMVNARRWTGIWNLPGCGAGIVWLKRVCAKTENQFSELIQIARILKLECCLQNSMVSIGFLSLFMFCTNPFVRLKAARASPLSETRARSSLSNENSPETIERCRRFQKNEILIHISCTESADSYYFLTVFHRYNYTYLELTFINKTKVILMTDITITESHKSKAKQLLFLRLKLDP